MSKPKSIWWGYVKNMIRKYPDNVSPDEYRAASAAIAETESKPTGKIRMKIVRMVLMKGSHTIDGAAMACYVSPMTAKTYHRDFIRLVGKHFSCKTLLSEHSE